MRILITGAGGFIGSRIAAGVMSAGHEVIACGRSPDRLRLQFPSNKIVACDFSRDIEADWRTRLLHVDAVVNTAGIFRAEGRNTFEGVHSSGPRTLFDACAAVGVPKLIQISAMGADAEARSRFHLNKRNADEYCAALAAKHKFLHWTVLRPLSRHRPWRPEHSPVRGLGCVSLPHSHRSWNVAGAANPCCRSRAFGAPAFGN
jgi:nucleoside-diphosphate-sugar epimerase